MAKYQLQASTRRNEVKVHGDDSEKQSNRI